MKLKKAVAALSAVLLCTVVCLSASAAEWEGEDFTFTVPEEFVYSFGPQTPQDDPSWLLVGISDPASLLQEYQEMGVMADFYTKDGVNLKVREQETDTTKSIFSMKSMSEEELAEFLDNQIQSQSEDVVVAKECVQIDNFPFFRVRIDSTGEQSKAHELIYYTILNGRTLVFDMYGGEKDITAEQEELLKQAVDSLRITQILEKPEPEPVNIALVILLLALIIVMVVAPFIYIPLRNRWDKKQKAKMAERLSEYRKTHGEDVSLGEPRFVNETECTREAIRTFSLYHSYGKGIVSLLLGGVTCAAALAVVFLTDMTWWLKVLAVGATVYFAYKTINLPNTVEKVQRKVFSRGVSSTARYTFYDEGFRVTGIQSASIYPYFQITSVRKHGHYLYLYYGPDNAYLMDQYGFSLGEFQDFTAFIREKTAKQKEKV